MQDSSLSLGDLSLDALVEFLEADGFVVVATNIMNDVQQLCLGKAIVQLVIDFFNILEVDFSLSLVINEIKSSSTALFREGISLD